MADESIPVEEVTIERDVRHESHDGVELSANVFRPSYSDEKPVPAIMNRTIYDIPEDVVGRGFYLDDAFASKALANGYAIVYQHSRGRGRSEGEFNWPVHEKEDGASAIEWLADRPWCTGDVGLWGGSNRGTTQMLATAADPEPLKAIHPIAVPNRRLKFGMLEPHSTVPVAMKNATLSAIRLNQRGELDDETLEAIQEAAMEANENSKALSKYRPLIDLPDHVFADVDLPDGMSAKDLIPFWEEQLANRENPEYWRSIDLTRMYQNMDVPALHVTGWFDSCQNGTMSAFRGMRSETTRDQYLIAGPYHHMNIGQTMCLGDVDFGPQASLTGLTFSSFAELEVGFFDVYLKGQEPPADSMFDERTPSVQTFRMHDDGGEWITGNDWPAPDTVEQTLFLESDGEANSTLHDGRLTDERTTDGTAKDRYLHNPKDPVPSRGGPMSARYVDHQPGVHDVSDIQRRADVLTYTSGPLEQPLEIAGSGHATLFCATEAADADFIVRLSHVLDDGRALNIVEGGQRLQYCGDGYVPEPPTPGECVEARVEFWDTHYRIPAGDRLRLEVKSTSFPRFDPHPGTANPWGATDNEVTPAEQTVFHDQERPSALTIDVME